MSLIEHVENVDAFEGLSAQKVASLPRDYTADEVTGIIAALRFASEHPEHDFAAMLPGVNQSNAKIHGFLVKIMNSIEAAGLAPD